MDEPAPPLRGLLDLPLRSGELPEATAGRIEALHKRVSSPGAPWIELYAEAIAIVEDAAGRLTGLQDDLQRQILALPDAAAIRAKGAGEAKRDLDARLGDMKTAMGRLQREWSDRSKRQQEQVHEQCMHAVRNEIVLREEIQPGGLVLAIEPTYWAELRGFFARCGASWTERVASGYETALASEVAAVSRAPIARGLSVAPPSPEAVELEATLRGEPPEGTRADVPSVGSAFFGYLRANVMTASTVSMMLAGPFMVFAVVFGASSNSVGMGMLRGSVILLALPPLGAYAVFAAVRERRLRQERAVADADKVLRSGLESLMRKALDAHRDGLLRWMERRGEAWDRAVRAWLRDEVQPALEGLEAGAQQDIQENKLAASRLQDRHQALRGLQNTLTGNLLFDLRRRHRDLTTGA